MATWCCDDTNEGTLHNGHGDARVDGLAGVCQTDAETDDCIARLEQNRKRSRPADGAEGSSAAAAPPAPPPLAATGDVSDSTPLSTIFGPLTAFTLRSANDGGPELKLYDAMASPDRQLIKAGYFVAEGALVVQQLLRMPELYPLVSVLSTEAQLRKLAPDIREAEVRHRARAAAAAAAADAANGEAAALEPPCLVFAGNRGHVSSATGFKHSALSVLAIARRPTAVVHQPIAQWLPTLRPAEGAALPTLLVLDAVVKPENCGSLFRTALAFGCAGVLLGPGCADPLYRKSVRSSMGACFKLPYLHAPRWPAELDELRAAGYRLLALHLQGSVAHHTALEQQRQQQQQGRRQPIAVMVGAEYEGVGDAAAACADACVRIPMSGAMDTTLDSLNVNVAAAIVLERVFSLNAADEAEGTDAAAS